LKRCPRCKESKSLDCFQNHQGNEDGKCNYCAECKSVIDKESYGRRRDKILLQKQGYYIQNQDGIKQVQKKYRDTHLGEHLERNRRRRAIRKDLHEHFTEEEWQVLLCKYGSKCLRCDAPGELTRDHVIPLYMGGSDAIDNIQPLCHRCNSAKGISCGPEWDFRIPVDSQVAS